MLHIVDQVFSLACLVLAVRVICSALLVQSLPVAVDTMDEGKQKVSLFDFQYRVLQPWIHSFLEIC